MACVTIIQQLAKVKPLEEMMILTDVEQVVMTLAKLQPIAY